MLSEIEYLGHVIDESGFHPTQEKVNSIQEAPEPKKPERATILSRDDQLLQPLSI